MEKRMRRINSVNRKDIVSQAAKSLGVPEAEVLRAFDACLDTIASNLKNDQQVRISGFGNFQVKFFDGRKVMFMGEPSYVPARNEVKFKASKELNESVN
jgi:DNA-binding protein HU-beta